MKSIEDSEIKIKKKLTQKYPGIKFLGDPDNHIPGLIGMLIPNIINEKFIKEMADKNICAISSGSACGIGEPSYVIKEIGLSNYSNTFVRLSVNKYSLIKEYS